MPEMAGLPCFNLRPAAAVEDPPARAAVQKQGFRREEQRQDKDRQQTA
jgi:hypothetical protein